MSNNIANADTPSLPYYVATYKSRSVAIKRDADYQSTIKLVQKSIPKLRLADVENIFISTKLADFGNAPVQISEEIWSDMVTHLKTVEITLEDQTDADHPTSQRVDGEDENMIPGQQGEHMAIVATAANSASERTRFPFAAPINYRRAAFLQMFLPKLQHTKLRRVPPIHPPILAISVRTTSQALLELSDLRPSSTISDLKSLIEMAYRVPAVLQRLDLHGQPLDDAKTLEQCKISDWTILDLYLNARQYMIYLYPDPTLSTSERFCHRNVEVKLSLNRSWELADLRPSRKAPLNDYAQSVSWTVDVAPGALLDKGSSVELTCLYWDGM
ncbi:hypothetical protein FRC06_006386 [Ceratobasidium sp. 370]|nr:hypothetical protein FRC06_006386 [Ceratobasidium sp. 370]